MTNPLLETLLSFIGNNAPPNHLTEGYREPETQDIGKAIEVSKDGKDWHEVPFRGFLCGCWTEGVPNSIVGALQLTGLGPYLCETPTREDNVALHGFYFARVKCAVPDGSQASPQYRAVTPEDVGKPVEVCLMDGNWENGWTLSAYKSRGMNTSNSIAELKKGTIIATLLQTYVRIPV